MTLLPYNVELVQFLATFSNMLLFVKVKIFETIIVIKIKGFC
jgi:hypothetical protein